MVAVSSPFVSCSELAMVPFNKKRPRHVQAQLLHAVVSASFSVCGAAFIACA